MVDNMRIIIEYRAMLPVRSRVMSLRGGRGRRCGREEEGDRLSYLRQLIDELNITTSLDAKYQVLANLSNFAYDPFNYAYLRQVGAVDIFLKELQSSDETLVHFASSAICNLCLDPKNAQYILKRNGTSLLTNLLLFDKEETKLNAITSLIFLADWDKNIINDVKIIECMLKLKISSNCRFANVANIFLNSICKD